MLEKDTKLEIENRSTPFIAHPSPAADINPETPLVQVDSKKEAYSKSLNDICSNSRVPCVVMRGVASALKMDLGFFSTKNLTQAVGHQKVNISTQQRESCETWKLDEKSSHSSVSDYGEYQGRSFREALNEDSRRSEKKARLP